jgi:hypothetical protein
MTASFFTDPYFHDFFLMNVLACSLVGASILLKKIAQFRGLFALTSFFAFYFALPILNLAWFIALANPDFSISTRFYSALIFVPQTVPILLMGYARLLRWPAGESLPWPQREKAWRISAPGILVFLVGCLYTLWLIENFGGADLHE